MTLHAFTDGASRGNPGDAGIGVVIKTDEGTVIVQERKYLGKATNNVAEYTALIVCLEKIQSLQCSQLIIHSDSELMVKQMNGEYKVKDVNLKLYFMKAKDMLRSASYSCIIRHIPRSLNKEADILANEGIDFR